MDSFSKSSSLAGRELGQPNMEPDLPSLEQRIQEIAKKHMDPFAASDVIDQDADLQALGIDSMKSITMLLELESAFGFNFSDDLLSPENFQSLRKLNILVTSALKK